MFISRPRRARSSVVSIGELDAWPFTPPPRRIQPMREPGPDLWVIWTFVFVTLAVEGALFAALCVFIL